jgi:RNA polymerase sigma-70 factor, ECF subfamily
VSGWCDNGATGEPSGALTASSGRRVRRCGCDVTDDAQLLEEIAAGDRAALRVLFDRHARWLALRLQRRCADRGLVDEAVSDTFLTVWRKAGTYRGEGEVGAWLWAIAMRRLLAQLRVRRPQPADLLPERRGVTRSAEDEVLVGLEFGDAGAALQRLSPELRAVLQATVLDGLTTREASDLLGVPRGTVKTRAMRARAALREELA